MIKFGYTILYVEDVEKSIEFYENVFGFARKFISPDNDYGELNTGETTISFASKKLASHNLSEGFIESSLEDKPFAIELGFITEDVGDLVQKATSFGAVLVTEPKKKPWGQVVAYVRDTDGFLLEICTPMHG
ncbi:MULTISPECIES: VOC family protein [Flavobacterium]|jgi:lactoylglutathione lyase|uniref:VOC family protein n=1 Tax=Flavobacterium TaxID=237 RepID=UPI0006ABEAAA|nr:MULTISPECIES: VOC family protein [Flavobacterium]KOP35910.1 glyoxalase [Flavobacterium sp. VMW]KRB57585.1 glyoxalase [Flavobacterium sp. Root186]MDR6764646.1 putative glyoxalase superfamily protein PhnB [Flavobacterium sp. 2755]OWU88962.1 glyoxalase [Flavobacterium sp. NLM]PUU68031.1 VOC family protein [Flavobacterium sp. WLB]